MSRLEELIKELCPDGVECRRLSEVSEMKRGTSITKKIISSGKFPVISGGREPAYYCDEYNREGETITVAGSGAGAGYVQYWTKPIFVCDAFSIQGKPSVVKTKYLYYILTNIQDYIYSTKKGGGVPHVHISCVENIQIPVPPIPVQEEIVRILDSFTELTAELTANLTAEITARKKQYEYYRNALLNNHTLQSNLCSISELGKWSGGKTPSMERKEFWTNGTIPWISSKDMKEPTLSDTEDHISEQAVIEASMTIYPKHCIAIVTRSGILKHTLPVSYVPFATTVNQDIKVLVPNERVLPRFAYHLLQTYSDDIRAKTKKQGGTVDSLDFQAVLSYKVPVPPKDVQERLIQVLDNFDSICSDLKIGLPAEIEARRKQYEYYREKLLAFHEMSN